MFELGCNIDVSDQTNLRGITGIAQLTFSGGSSSSPLSSRAFLIGATPGAYGPDDAAFSMRMAIQPAIVPADATGFTSCRGELQIVFAGAGEATVDISRFTAIMTLPG